MPKKARQTETLDIKNVLEADKIRELLLPHPDLLSFFEILVIMCNNRLNDEKVAKQIDMIIDEALEAGKDPDLSDHSSDEE